MGGAISLAFVRQRLREGLNHGQAIHLARDLLRELEVLAELNREGKHDNVRDYLTLADGREIEQEDGDDE